MSKPMIIKYDDRDRPAKASWAPGNYLCACLTCKSFFSGDKRAIMCADCAYPEKKDTANDIKG